MNCKRAVLIGFWIFAGVISSASAQTVTPPVTIQSVHIVSGSIGDLPTDKNKTIDFDDDARIYAVAIGRDGQGRQVYLCAADTIVMQGRTIAARPFDESLDNVIITWLRIENDSRGKYYSNTSPHWHWDKLDYKETIIGTNTASIAADVAPTILSPVLLDGTAVGTMRYRVRLSYDGKEYSSPGSDTLYKGGVTEAVHRVSRRGNTDNPILDNGFALCNCPYIWGSASFTGSRFDNQAERFLGADCADFVVAAARMAGYEILPYAGSRTLGTHTVRVALMRRNIDGVYHDGERAIQVDSAHVRPGDFIVWDGHVGLIYKDTEPFGVLDGTDLVLHTLFNEPGITNIENAFRGTFEIFRPK